MYLKLNYLKNMEKIILNYEEMELSLEDVIIGTNDGVNCDLVKIAMERDPLPIVIY